MASLQSPRTQCCCCAVGVFAAMFGIFMLSAGICIVLNVTFMEVDTSGLPPELHNDNGKKVVGIILICVAIAFLGLSATVSVLYFTLCSRKERPPASSASAANQNQQQQQLHGARTRHSHNGGRRGLDRPNSKDSVKNGSQASLRSGRSIASPSAIDGVQFSKSVASAVPGRLQNQGSRNHAHAGAYSRTHGHPKKKGIRPGRYRGPGLEPHLEEDVEMAKSGDRSRPTSAKDAGTGEGAGAASASASSHVPPAIVIDETSQDPFTPMSTMSSCDDYMETQFTENGLPYDRDDSVLTNTFDDEQSLQGAMGAEGGSYPSHYNDTSFPDSDGYAAEYNKQDFSSHQPVTYGTDSLEGSLSSSSSNNNVLNDKLSRNHSSSPPPTISNTQLHHNILKVKPSKDADINTPGSSSNTLDSLDQYEMNVEENDHQPSSSNTNSQDVNRQISGTTEGDSQGSQGSFNPAFSYDGEDPETVDTQKRSNKFIDERL